ncbi:MAG: short-chain dehydrogenase [Nocardioidaceae bacterium]|nr:short-chain dehydrogenase [Nocardioidaceae bacterium]
MPPRTQTSLVTGATAGIGLAFSRALAARGDDLVLVARDEDRLDRVAEELLSAYGGEVRVVPADLATDDGTERVAEMLREEAIDLLVNNAGHGTRTSFLATPVADEDVSLDLMVRAPMRLCHAALPGMLDRRRGAVLNVASVAAFVPRGTYGAHKAWLVSFTRWLSVRHRRRGVRAMVLCPGLVRTEFHQRMQVDVSSVPRWMWLDADRVVRDALTDLSRGVIVSVPSRRYQVLTRLARLTPPSAAERFSRRG